MIGVTSLGGIGLVRKPACEISYGFAVDARVRAELNAFLPRRLVWTPWSILNSQSLASLVKFLQAPTAVRLQSFSHRLLSDPINWPEWEMLRSGLMSFTEPIGRESKRSILRW